MNRILELLASYIDRDPRAEGALKSSVPIGFTGQIILWPSVTPPAGWLLCDGSLKLIAEYPDLSLQLGSAFANSATDFYLPDIATQAYDSGWVSPPRGANYSGATTLAVRRIGNTVHIRGQATRNSGTPTSGDTIMTLASGFRPALDNPQGKAGSGTNYGKIDIVSSTGVVSVATTALGGGYLLLNDIVFITNDPIPAGAPAKTNAWPIIKT